MAKVMGIDLGGTKLLARIEDESGQCVWSRSFPTGRHYGPNEFLNTTVQLVNLAQEGGVDIGALGVGFPGLTDSTVGVVRSSVILDGWTNVPLKSRLQEELLIPCGVDNDVNNAARAERDCRSPREKTFLFISLGTGIGGALVLDERIWIGNGYAGEIGHMVADPAGPKCVCGRNGCIGVLAGGEQLQATTGCTASELGAAIAACNPEVLKAIDIAAQHLGSVIADAINLLDLQLVVFGGGLAEAFLCPASKTAREDAFDEISAGCRFELAMAGYDAAAIGAVLLGQETLVEAQ